jgi:hypothetical protein
MWRCEVRNASTIGRKIPRVAHDAHASGQPVPEVALTSILAAGSLRRPEVTQEPIIQRHGMPSGGHQMHPQVTGRGTEICFQTFL